MSKLDQKLENINKHNKSEIKILIIATFNKDEKLFKKLTSLHCHSLIQYFTMHRSWDLKMNIQNDYQFVSNGRKNRLNSSIQRAN